MLISTVAAVVLNIPSNELKMVVCDVGQGDAILLTQGTNQVLIDGGKSGSKVLECLRRHIPFWDRKLEVIVVTNSDADHSGGLNSVIDRYDLIYFVSGEGLQNTDILINLANSVRVSDAIVVGVRQGDEIRVGRGGELILHVLWPNELKSKKVAIFTSEFNNEELEQILGESATRGDINEKSVVIDVEWGGKHVLLMGDSGEVTEKALLDEGLLRNVDVLKVGHHGSKYSSSLEFLMLVRPEIAVISVGKNSYGHPTSETINRLENVGAKVLRTDQEGDIVIGLGAVD